MHSWLHSYFSLGFLFLYGFLPESSLSCCTTSTYTAATSLALNFAFWRPLRRHRRYPWIMARGRSTSSSPDAHRHRGKRDRRTSRRSRSPRRKSSGLPVENPPSTTSFETRYPIPKAWSPDDIYLDRQQQYKLTFPRRVVATAWSRDLHIDHQPIEDVRLIDVLSRKQENWTLRLVANVRLVQYEGFRNRQEAYLWSSLSRKIFKSSDVDIARIIGHLHPASLKDDWDEKRKGLDRLAERVFDHLRDQMPKNTTEALQDQVEQLMKENEKLEAATGRPSSPALSPSEPQTPADRERLRVDKSKPLITPPAPPRSGRTLDCHFKPATPELDKTTPPPAVPSDPLHAYIVGTNRPVLEDNAPVKASKTEIDKWIKANIKDKARLTKLEDTAKEIDSIITNLKADKLDLPNLCRLTIAWGWDPKLAQSAAQNALIRMLATANALVA